MLKILLLLLISPLAFGSVVHDEVNCRVEAVSEPKLKMSDLKWGQSLLEMSQIFKRVYGSGKRLEFRAYKEGDTFILPTRNGNKVVIGDNFINNLKNHIEMALNRHYADYIFFSDMGHAHLFVDKKLYTEKVKPISSGNKHLKSEVMLNSKSTKFLYHTAEQLKMLGDDKLPVKDKKTQWRFFSRNLVGQNLHKTPLEVVFSPNDPNNSVRGRTYDIHDQYKYWGSGFDFSASKDGCFQYEHKGVQYNFDISLYAVR